MERLKALDEGLFRLLNLDLTHPLLDILMPWVTEPRYFFIPLVLAGSGLIIWGGKRGKKAILLALIALAISDQSSLFLKDQIQRIRPCGIKEDVRLLVGCTQSFSIPSAHAANVFSVANILSFFYKRLSPFFLFVSFLVAYSRVYVGVHYPSDVLSGAFLGSLLAFSIILVERKIYRMKKGP